MHSHMSNKMIQENKTINLSAADWAVFLSALTNPPPPNAALRKAFAQYRKTVQATATARCPTGLEVGRTLISMS